MIPNIKIKPNENNSTSNSIQGSRAYTFLDSYIYMKNQRYNALYEKNKEILAIENNALLLKSPSILYNAFIEQSRILDSVVIRIRNFVLRIKPDIIDNINYLIPSKSALQDFYNVINEIPDIPRMKYMKYDIQAIEYENMASFMNLYKAEIRNYTDINNQTANKENPFIRDRAAKYLIETAMKHANVHSELLEMQSIKIVTPAKLKSIYSFFIHKNKFLATIQRDFKTFQFYLRQYSGLKPITNGMNPTEMRDGRVLLNGSSVPITFNDYFVLYKHFVDMIKYMIKIIGYHEQQYFNKIYALQGNIESYSSIINDVIDYGEKYKLERNNEEDSLNESTIISHDDIYKNFDKFENGESNIVLVTGLTGSGKSTISQKIIKNYNANWIEIDLIEMILRKQIDTAKAGEPFDSFIKSHKFEEELSNNNIFNYNNKFIEYCLSWCKKQKNKKFVIEGIQIYEYYSYNNKTPSYPIIFKGTSVLKSFIRKIKREDWNTKEIFNNMPETLKFMKLADKDMQQVINSLNESISENSHDPYNEVCRIAYNLGYESPGIIENNCFSLNTSHNPITKERFDSLGYSLIRNRGSFQTKYPTYRKDVDNGYFEIKEYNPNEGWHIFNLKFIDENFNDTYDLINGNQEADQLLNDNSGMSIPDSIEGITDEEISNFNEYESSPKEEYSICTMKNSLSF